MKRRGEEKKEGEGEYKKRNRSIKIRFSIWCTALFVHVEFSGQWRTRKLPGARKRLMLAHHKLTSTRVTSPSQPALKTEDAHRSHLGLSGPWQGNKKASSGCIITTEHGIASPLAACPRAALITPPTNDQPVAMDPPLQLAEADTALRGAYLCHVDIDGRIRCRCHLGLSVPLSQVGARRPGRDRKGRDRL